MLAPQSWNAHSNSLSLPYIPLSKGIIIHPSYNKEIRGTGLTVTQQPAMEAQVTTQPGSAGTVRQAESWARTLTSLPMASERQRLPTSQDSPPRSQSNITAESTGSEAGRSEGLALPLPEGNHRQAT